MNEVRCLCFLFFFVSLFTSPSHLRHKPRPLRFLFNAAFFTPFSRFLSFSCSSSSLRLLCLPLLLPSHYSSSPPPLNLLLFFYLLSFFLPLFLLSYSYSSSSSSSPLLAIGDAAKRSVWRLSRVGSLRSIYTTSLLHSEGKGQGVVVDLRRTGVPSPPCPLPVPPLIYLTGSRDWVTGDKPFKQQLAIRRPSDPQI